MEAQRARWLVVVMTVGALTVPPAAPAQEVSLIGELRDAQRRTAALCGAAEGVWEIDARAARRLYIRALSTGARNTRCAASGLTEIANAASAKAEQAPTTLDKARALIANGYHEEGDELLRSQLAEVPAASIPKDLQPDSRALATAEALWSQGYETEAQEHVRTALAADPSNPVPSELQKAERKPLEVRQMIGIVGGGLVTAALIAALVGLIAALIRMVVLHVRRRIVTEEFKGGSDGAGAALQAEMQDRFHAWARGSASRYLGTAAGTDQGISAASLTEAIPAAGLLVEAANAIDRLLPNRTWVLAGQFLPYEPINGVGIALRVYRKSNGKILLADTLRQAEFQAPPGAAGETSAEKLAYQRLAIACAAFVLYVDQGNLRVSNDHETLGTKDWRSYAMATSAAAYYPNEPDVARRLYRRALERDEEYKDARFGLAVIELQDAEGRKDKLDHVDSELQRVAASLNESQSLWYRTKFWRLIALMYRDMHSEAHDAAQELFGSGTQWWSQKKSEELKAFVPKHRDTMLVAAAAALERAREPAPSPLADHVRHEFGLIGDVTGQAIVAALEPRPDLHWRARYNLASYYAMVRPPGGWIGKGLKQLDTALQTGGAEFAELASRDWSLKALRDGAGPRFRRILLDAGFPPAKEGRRKRSADSASQPGAPSNGSTPAPV